jgi:hypothetical protein
VKRQPLSAASAARMAGDCSPRTRNAWGVRFVVTPAEHELSRRGRGRVRRPPPERARICFASSNSATAIVRGSGRPRHLPQGCIGVRRLAACPRSPRAGAVFSRSSCHGGSFGPTTSTRGGARLSGLRKGAQPDFSETDGLLTPPSTSAPTVPAMAEPTSTAIFATDTSAGLVRARSDIRKDIVSATPHRHAAPTR